MKQGDLQGGDGVGTNPLICFIHVDAPYGSLQHQTV